MSIKLDDIIAGLVLCVCIHRSSQNISYIYICIVKKDKEEKRHICTSMQKHIKVLGHI